MSITRTLLLNTGIVTDTGIMALIVTAVGLVGALCIWWSVRRTPFSFLFVRPAWMHLTPKRTFVLQPAE
jgi:hypothetical protein